MLSIFLFCNIKFHVANFHVAKFSSFKVLDYLKLPLNDKKRHEIKKFQNLQNKIRGKINCLRKRMFVVTCRYTRNVTIKIL